MVRPTVENIRVHSLKLENVKCVRHGEILIHRGSFDQASSDIIGIYGQNGSGKTTVVDAFTVLQHLMRGDALPEEAEGLISMGSDTAELLFRFLVQEPSDASPQGYVEWEVSYELTLVRSDNGKTCVGGERIRGKLVQPKRPNSRPREWFVSRNAPDAQPISPDPLWHALVSKSKQIENEIRANQTIALHEGRSFLFSDYMLTLLAARDVRTVETAVLRDLSDFAHTTLFVVNKVHTGLIYTNLVFPLSFRHAHGDDTQITASGGTPMLALAEQDVLPSRWFEDFGYLLEELNTVLDMLIPGFSLRTEILSESLNQQKEKEIKFELVASRGQVEIPFRYESNGVRRLVSVPSLLLSVYNDPAVCVVIDELDVGIFEYLLGQLIRILAKSGCGQLIFTSHNMRPLEVLRPQQVVVTTTDAADRFDTLKHIKPTHNTRNQYYERVSTDKRYYSGKSELAIERAFQQVGATWTDNQENEQFCS